MVQVVNENMMDFLSGYTVSHVAKEKKSPRKIIGISSDNTIEDALVLMRENKTLYLGVCFDSSGENTGNIHKYGKFEDLLGLIDLINFVVTNVS
ncbi:hypothetical protein AX774_g2385 [Zancudomyces culisetae]|uniref:CBS domain-containing protein n=1 Tax=Zancudomyces culisetae TaxID=1213189 RepID=A0A1R1PT19_ZANCU|nr:hypothetical protein AX774_g2385 [Zancudomyces culisetae]|eukprot:OMH84097.1 hypothetical protein AX774_g2385 [Zancudomyces culisetae]